MATIIRLNKPIWVFDGTSWEMQIGTRGVAALMPNIDEILPHYQWLSCIHPDFPDHGWSNVDFETAAAGKYSMEQWWLHLCRGQLYRP